MTFLWYCNEVTPHLNDLGIPGESMGCDFLGMVDEEAVMREFPLDALDPTQRVFVSRVLAWARSVKVTYKEMQSTGVPPAVPVPPLWFGG